MSSSTSTPNAHQVERVLKHIKDMLYTGRLLPGERLPAERRLAEHLQVSRAHVRTAFKKLEFYGIVKTFPQSGTVVVKEKMQVLGSLITDALQIDQYDFASLVYVRVLLEMEAVKLCARNCTDDDLVCLEEAMLDVENNIKTPDRVSKDLMFHQAIARGAHNPVIASMLLIIAPDVLKYFQKYKLCNASADEGLVIDEHRELFRCIKERDQEGAQFALRKHLSPMLEFSKRNNNDNFFPSKEELK